ncbi:MAG: hypothetical protein GFH27_549367n8 [Chloroflexi bacterium AL-W]|nr:hypothetical protein [Chloroflexi bacterium AL-W]
MSEQAEFNQAVDTLINRMNNVTPMTFDDLRDVAGLVVQAGEFVDDETRSQGVGRMVDTILAAPTMRSAMVAIACGALVEQGAHPYIAIHAIITRLGEALGHAAQFAQACIDRAQTDNVPPEEAIDRYGQALSRTMSAQANAYSAMELFCRPAVAMISRSKRARRAANDEGRMASRLRRFPVHHDMLHWLAQLLAVVDDEEIIVLHPEYQLGYRVQIEGIAGNHQLFVLLEDALIGDETQGWLPGEKPRPQVVAAATQYNQYNHSTPYMFGFHYASWQSLNPEGYLNIGDNAEQWLWAEGIPADIPKFEDVRVILLGPTPYTRTFGINAIFEGLEPNLQVLEQLSAEAVKLWLHRLMN